MGIHDSLLKEQSMAKSIPERIRKKIYQESGMACPICGEENVATFEIHHIKPISEGGKDEEGNLILLCSNCHSKVTHGEIKTPEILKLKKSLRNADRSRKTESVSSNVINFLEGINQGTIANVVNKTEIVTQSKTVKVNPPDGSIASNLMHKNYIKHLIDRYHEFKKFKVGRAGMKYAILYDSIKRGFGAKWDMIPMERFDELSEFLQQQIDRTFLGKTRKSRRQKNYSTFSEYCDKYGKS